MTGYIEAIEAIAAKNPEGVIVQPLFSLPDYCLQFNEKKVPLCFVNIAPEISDTSKNLEYYYAGCFDTKIGEQLAEEMAKGLKQNAKIGVICLPYGQTNAEQRRTGFETWMKANRPRCNRSSRSNTLKRTIPLLLSLSLRTGSRNTASMGLTVLRRRVPCRPKVLSAP